MKFLKNIFVIFVTFWSLQAFAEWTQFSESTEGIFYIDIATATKKPLPKIWTMLNLHDKDSYGRRSQSTLIQANCGTKQFRTLSMSFHEDQMGAGKVIYMNNSDNAWMYAPPNSMLDSLLNFMCKK